MGSRVRITLVNTFFPPTHSGGAEHVVASISEELAGRGHEVEVVTLSPRNQASADSAHGARVKGLPIANVYWPDPGVKRALLLKAVWHSADSYNLAMQHRVWEAIRHDPPSIIHTHNLRGFSPSVWPLAGRLGSGLVHTVHDYGLLCLNSALLKRGKPCPQSRCPSCKAARYFAAKVSSEVGVVTGVSKAVLRAHLQRGYFPHASSRVVHNFTRLESPVLRRPHHPRPARVFGYMGQLAPHKGLDTLLRGFMLVAGNHNVELAVAGKGEDGYVQELETISRGYPVTFAGFVNAADFLGSIDVLVVPSTWEEPSAMVIFEALGTGTPVIATAVGGTPELITDQLEGLLVPPRSPEALASAMEYLANDSSFFESARRHALDRASAYSLTSTVDAYLESYELAGYAAKRPTPGRR